jgi:hypothetical protein
MIKPISFKNSETGNTIYIELDLNSPLKELRNTINEKVVRDLGITENYRIVKALQINNELAEQIDEKSEVSLFDYINGKYYDLSFYITTESFFNRYVQNNCAVCFNNFICYQDNLNCLHNSHICRQCANNWFITCDNNDSERTCPICRTVIQN